MKSKPLGKGLQALFGESNLSDYHESTSKFLEIPAKEIRSNPFQPREKIDKEQFQSLKSSIQKTGLIQPIAVRQTGDRYELVAGERRLRAVIDLNIPTIPAYVLDIKNDRQLLEVSLLENLRRENLNPIEIAAGYKRLNDEFEMSQKEISESFSIDRSTVANIMRLLKLPEEIQNNVKNGELSMGHARVLIVLHTAKEQKALAKRIMNDGLNVRQAEALSKRSAAAKSRKSKNAAKKSPALVQLEDKLRYAMGSQVRIKPFKEGGKIEIDYYSSEDLNRLMDLFAIIEKNIDFTYKNT